MSAATRVTLTDHQRTVVYRIYLYLPTAESTHARLTELTERLVATEQCTTSIVLSDSQAMVTVDVTFDSLEELADIGAALSESLAQDPDLISALLGAPWGGSVDTWQYPRTLWQDQFVYREHIDKSSVDTLWQTNAQYAEWRLIELADAPAETERARMEKRLAQIALNEQRLIWEYLPRSSYWVYAVAPENTPWTKETLVPWGQQRVLEAVHSVYRWRSVALTALLAGACLGTMVVVTLLVRRKRLR